MFEWGAAFVKLTGKYTRILIISLTEAYNCEPETVLGCVVLGTTALVGVYVIGSVFAYVFPVSDNADSLGDLPNAVDSAAISAAISSGLDPHLREIILFGLVFG